MPSVTRSRNYFWMVDTRCPLSITLSTVDSNKDCHDLIMGLDLFEQDYPRDPCLDISIFYKNTYLPNYQKHFELYKKLCTVCSKPMIYIKKL